MKKYGLILRSAVVVAVLVAARILVHALDLDNIAVSPLISAFVGGVIFTIAVIFTGTLADYKESEKIPGELAASIKSLYNDTVFIPAAEAKTTDQMRAHIKALLQTLNANFRRNKWDLKEVNASMNEINQDLRVLVEKGVPAPCIVKFRAELSNVDKTSNRVETISRTSFIPAAYAIAELAIGLVLLVLLFSAVEYWEGLLLFGSVSFLLVSVLMLIKDMDNPFEVGDNSFADVDLTVLFDLEPRLDENDVPATSGDKRPVSPNPVLSNRDVKLTQPG